MRNESQKIADLESKIAELREKVEEATETLQAIRTGQVDAIVVEGEQGHQIYSLKSADHTYRVFIEKMKEGAVTLSRHGIILYSNSQFANMVRRSLHTVVGNEFVSFVAKSDRKKFLDLVAEAWENDVKGEILLKAEKNSSHPFLLSLTTLEFDEGLALSIICTDLGGQKQAEALLKKQNEELEIARRNVSIINEQLEEIVNERTKDLLVSREHFKFLADNIPVIVWTATPGGEPDYFNKKWTDYTGLSMKDSVGTGWLRAIHADDIEAATHSWKQAVASEEPFYNENRLLGLNGLYRWYVVYAVPFRDENGKLITWLGTSTDIEDRKMEMDRKDEFIGMASHELKTPLTSLKGYIQLMDQAKEGLPLDVSMYLKKANESVSKLQHLIDDLLDVSKIQSGKLDFHRSQMDIGMLVSDTVDNSRHLYPHFSIKKDIEGRLLVSGNADRLDQVLMNLINNAVKYSGDTRDITVSVMRESTMVRVSVKDKGIGLTDEDKKLVFDRFYRVPSTKHTGGLGMGLYIASEIVKAHGGKFLLESKLHRGSEFSFLLPLL